MKKYLCLVFYSLSRPLLACDTNSLLDIYASKVPMELFLSAIAEQQNINIALPYPLEKNVSLQLKQICAVTLFNQLATTYQLEIEQHNTLWTIFPEESKTLNTSNYWPITLKYSSPSDIATKIEQAGILSKTGKIIIASHKQQLIIYDELSKKPLIDNFIQLLDKKRGQIHITAQLITVNREKLHELGINWSSKTSSNQFDVSLGLANPSSQAMINLGKWTGKFLELELSALEAEHKIEIIASPHLITQDGYAASIQQGTEIPYEITRDGSSSFEFKQAVLGLKVTPNIINNDEVLLTLSISQNTPGVALKRGNGGDTITIDTQEINTQLLIKQGETLVLGGIKQKQQINKQNSVPLLGRLPLLGVLFKNKQIKEESKELVIFITPHIL